jgi:hypothetical protein
MMIELDYLNADLLNMVLNTLEHYELYRMCLMMCDRYKINRKGRYIAGIAQKYSNLS